jgi:hypothetical protein
MNNTSVFLFFWDPTSLVICNTDIATEYYSATILPKTRRDAYEISTDLHFNQSLRLHLF